MLIRIDTDICLLSYGTFVGFVTAHFTERFQYGGGRHGYDVPPEYLDGYIKVGLNHRLLFSL